MHWLLVIGVSLEIAGALLVVGPLLLPIVLRDWSQLALRGYLFTRGGPRIEDMREQAYATVGSLLLVGGFATQLAGYVVEFRSDVVVGAAVGTAVSAIMVGVAVARFVIARWLLAKARAHDPTEVNRS